MHDYPRLVINKQKLRENIDRIVDLCAARGLSVSGVVKGFNGLPELVWLYDETRCEHIADSRLDRLRQYKQMGIKKPLMLLRIPMPSEAAELVRYCDISLNSVYETVEAINAQCGLIGVTHDVILMLDLGDLREGIMDEDEAVETAVRIVKNLKHVRLRGLGTNLGCYGAVKPSKTNIGKLLDIAHKIEAQTGRQFDIISAGATSSLPLTLSGDMPQGATNLRIGEGIQLAQDIDKLWRYEIAGMHQDAFLLEAQVIEVRNKPSHPIGEVFVDAFGNTPEFKDIGIRKKALVALGKLDVGSTDDLDPTLPGITVLGGSSDHIILDIEDCPEDIKTGTILTFELYYGAMLFATSSATVRKCFI